MCIFISIGCTECHQFTSTPGRRLSKSTPNAHVTVKPQTQFSPAGWNWSIKTISHIRFAVYCRTCSIIFCILWCWVAMITRWNTTSKSYQILKSACLCNGAKQCCDMTISIILITLLIDKNIICDWACIVKLSFGIFREETNIETLRDLGILKSSVAHFFGLPQHKVIWWSVNYDVTEDLPIAWWS